ncbi:hypothetical protein E2C01_036477 [Portunus trituberculatus]|uniref:Uncharacterized protein n=1 Tax=Portunus trituberculatus TaxID=210409 RepID=A0A5B7FC14_PORTR|nr:hypothetical protein [Portunus trituberculatus]
MTPLSRSFNQSISPRHSQPCTPWHKSSVSL